MIDSDKLALQNSTAAIRCKIIVKATSILPEIVLTDEDAIKDWIYTDERYVPQQGFIGQFVARTLEGNLQDIDADFSIEGREIELQLGVIDFGERVIYMQTENGIQLMTESGEIIRLNQIGEDRINWYSYGNFIVTNPEDNEVSDNTKFEAMDYAKLFNKTFNSKYTDTTYTRSYNEIIEAKESVTALWLAKYVCAQVGVEFGQEVFTNSDFIIDRNPFQAGETCRDVIKCIAQLALSWARIDWDNKCYIDFGENTMMLTDDTANTIDNNQYYTLETKKEIYGPINAVYVGMENVDGTTLAIAKDDSSIAAHGEHAIYIYDNPLLYSPELRGKLEVNGSGYKLIGLSYNQLTTETVGHPWLKGNELITIVDMEDKPRATFAFNRTMEYEGHIKTTLDSMGETEVNETLAYKSDVIRTSKNALLLVDKANAKIDASVKEITSEDGVILSRVNTLELTSSNTTSRIEKVEEGVVKLGDELDKQVDILLDEIDDVDVKFTDFKDNEYIKSIGNLQKQIDGAIQFWNGPEIPTLSNYPAKDWATENDRINHQADIYTVIEDVDGELKQGKSYRFDKVNGNWVWIELTDNELSAVQQLAQEALDKARENEGDVILLKSDVSDLKQADDEITASVDSINNTLKPLVDISGSDLKLPDSTSGSLVNFELEGKTIQDVRSGKNKLPHDAITNQYVSVNSDGTYNIAAGTPTTTIYATGKSFNLPAGTYTFSSTELMQESTQIYLYNVTDNKYDIQLNQHTDTKTFTITSQKTMAVMFLLLPNVATVSKNNIGLQVETGTVKTSWEQYGAAPTPQFASELDSVGYENLLNLENISIGWATSNDELLQTLNSLNVGTYTLVLNFVVETITNNTNKNIFGAILINSHLNIDCRTTISTALKIGEVYTSKRVIEITKDNKGKFTVAYLYGSGNDDVGETAKTTTKNCMLIRGSQPRDYVPYGKYGIKIKTQCKNVYNATFNKTTSTGITRFADTQKLYLNGTPESENRFMLGSTKIPAGTYTLCLQLDSGKIADTAFFIYINNTWTTIASLRLNEQNGFKNHTTFTLAQEAEISLAAYMSTYQTCENAYVKYQVIEGSNADYVFEPYQEPGYTFVTLNGPLRSIPNGAKDMMYIKNNRLYVDRKISNIVLNGTQGCALYTFSGMNGVSIGSVLPTNMARVSGMCSRSTKVGEHYSSNSIWCGVNSKHIYWIGILDELGLSTAAELKTWLSTNNTEIIYESPEVVTEDYGEIELPVTYKTTTHITTDDTTQPTMNITYVKTADITDYIAGQFGERDIVQNRRMSELSVTADGISASVTSVTGDLAETNTKVNKLDTKLTSQEATLTIVSSHIDKDSNTLKVNEVTTTNGFTFNSEGLNIYTDADSYNTQIDNTGTYYKDGDEVVGQTSKDGSILKNLSQQGQAKYSYDGNVYDFIEERVYVDGEYCYATFYNGEE